MDKLKQWVALTALGAVGIVAVGWFVLVSPKRGEAADLRAQTVTQVDANAMLQTQIEVLKAKAKDLPKEQATLAAVAAKIPDNPALPGLVRALLDASATSGVELVSITPGTPVVVAPPAAAVAPVDGQSAPDPTVPAVVPGPGAAGQLANIPVAINVVGDYFEVAQFVAALEGLPRALRVNNLTLAPGASPTAPAATETTDAEDGSSLTTTINGFVFMSADTTPAPASAAPPANASVATTPAAPVN
jgi:Tfp pilus assembly protein PilO